MPRSLPSQRRFALALALAIGVFGGPGAAATPEASPPVLAPGAYRLEMRQVHASRFPVLGKTRTDWVSVALARVRESEEGLVQEHRVCDIRFESGLPLVEMVMPPATQASLVDMRYPVELERDGDGWRYRADFGFEHVGYEPARPGAPPPKRRDDPSIVDSDGDGKPGATLQLDVPILDPFELYVVQRGQTVLNGRVVAEGHVEGAVAGDVEQVVIGSDPYFLKRSPKLEPDRERSRFSMVRVPDGTTCETLVEASRPAPALPEATPEGDAPRDPLEAAAP
ncbi:MAG: hypothetical protein QNK04_23690 [Myxococcota bacterium]|nr:hypothetical protein [Myxococcota bacterium]